MTSKPTVCFSDPSQTAFHRSHPLLNSPDVLIKGKDEPQPLLILRTRPDHHPLVDRVAFEISR